jgi:hypothetical protein
MTKYEVIGVRIPDKTKRKVVDHAEILSIPQSSFIRVLINLALEQIENDPSILLKRTSRGRISGE